MLKSLRRRTLITPTSRDWPSASYEPRLKSFPPVIFVDGERARTKVIVRALRTLIVDLSADRLARLVVADGDGLAAVAAVEAGRERDDLGRVGDATAARASGTVLQRSEGAHEVFRGPECTLLGISGEPAGQIDAHVAMPR